MSGVEAMRRFLDCADVNIGGQLVVDLSAQRFGWQVRVQLQVRDLCERMDAGIGST